VVGILQALVKAVKTGELLKVLQIYLAVVVELLRQQGDNYGYGSK
jgi:hypothetical protein